MKSLTVRLPERLVAELVAESRERKIFTSDVVRERLQANAASRRERMAPLAHVEDLIGSIEGLPADVSARPRHYLRAKGYGRPRSR